MMEMVLVENINMASAQPHNKGGDGGGNVRPMNHPGFYYIV